MAFHIKMTITSKELASTIRSMTSRKILTVIPTKIPSIQLAKNRRQNPAYLGDHAFGAGSLHANGEGITSAPIIILVGWVSFIRHAFCVERISGQEAFSPSNRSAGSWPGRQL